MGRKREEEWRTLEELAPRLMPYGMGPLVLEHLKALETRHYSRTSLSQKAQALKTFAAWCEERGLRHPREVTRPILERYQRHLFLYRKSNGKPLGIQTQWLMLSAVRLFFRWLTRDNRLLYNPAADIQMPRIPQRLPQAVLTASEAEKVMAVPDVTTPLGIRDRAMLETLYSTGIRRGELVALEVGDVDYGRGVLAVRQGKGRKDRVIPVGERALAWVAKYVDEVRPDLVVSPDAGVLFLSKEGEALRMDRVSRAVADYIEAADIGKKGACHLFRHTMATLMLEGGADIRFIQAMLGHSDLSSTQLYTRVAISKLKDVHAATHPAAKLKQRRQKQEVDTEPSAEELLAAIAEEDKEEEA